MFSRKLTAESLVAKKITGSGNLITAGGDFLFPSTSGITAPSIGDSNGNRLVLDHENVWRSCKAEELRSYGYRRVQNLLSYSEDFSNAYWSTQEATVEPNAGVAPDGALTADKLIPSAVTSTHQIFKLGITSSVSTVMSIYVKDAGYSTFVILDGATANNGASFNLSTETVTNAGTGVGAIENVGGGWYRVSVAVASTGFRLYCPGATGTETGDGTSGLLIWGAQYEDATGRSDTTTPSEYVPTGVATGPELVTNGAFDSDTTGWTEVNGTLSVDTQRLKTTNDGTGTNRCEARQSITTVAGATYLVSVDGTSNSTSPLFSVGTSAGANDIINSANTNGGYKNTFTAEGATTHLTAKNNSTAAGASAFFDNISVKRIDHGANVDGVKYFTTLNGNTVNSNVLTEATGAAISSSTLKGYFAEGAATELSGYSNDFTNWTFTSNATATQNAVGLDGAANSAWTMTDNSAAATQEKSRATTITDDSATYHCMWRIKYNVSPSVYPRLRFILQGGTPVLEDFCFDPSDGSMAALSSSGTTTATRVGDWWFILSTVTNNSTGNTTAVQFTQPAYNTDASVTASPTAQGSTIYGSSELYKTTWSYSPILTTGGTTKTRLADVEATISGTAWPDGDVSVVFDLTVFNSGVNTGAQQSVFSPNDAGGSVNGILIDATADNRLGYWDGANYQVITNAWASVGETITVKFRANASTLKKNFSVAGTAATEAAYDGSFNPSGDITLFKSLTLGAAIKNLRIFSEDLGEGWLTS